MTKVLLASADRNRYYTSWFGPNDSHLSGEGYRLVAEIMKRDLERLGFLSAL